MRESVDLLREIYPMWPHFVKPNVSENDSELSPVFVYRIEDIVLRADRHFFLRFFVTVRGCGAAGC
ncbi:hypothetical protein FPK49_24640 [Acinetobacter baumannii]|nr:hypothetical protein [Acinetobacter baumannii]